MNASFVAEELLILMAYGIDLLTMPTFRKWNDSYEGWLYQNGLLSRIHYLESQRLLARQGKGKDWVFRLTRSGRARAFGGRDPEEKWKRKWDGWWRMLVFDLPVHRQRSRGTLIRWLRANGFGYLQDSVWVTPDPVTEVAKSLRGYGDDAESFTILECRCAPGFTNASLVKGAWKFEELRARYQAYEQFAAEAERRLQMERLHPRDLFAVLRAERGQWGIAFQLDPLLPKELLPSDYEGRRAWQARQSLLRLAAAQARTE